MVLPVTNNTSESIVENGVLLAEPSSPNYYSYYYGGSVSGCRVFAYNSNSNQIAAVVVFTEQVYYYSYYSADGVRDHYLSSTVTVDGNTYYYDAYIMFSASNTLYIDRYSTLEEGIRAEFTSVQIPITYYLTNCSAPSAPASVSPGGVVSFSVTVSPGYNIFNPVQGGSISVYQGDNYIPFTYENGVLTFTAPGGG